MKAPRFNSLQRPGLTPQFWIRPELEPIAILLVASAVMLASHAAVREAGAPPPMIVAVGDERTADRTVSGSVNNPGDADNSANAGPKDASVEDRAQVSVATATDQQAASPPPVPAPAPTPRDVASDYLWQVYQRAPVKKDSHGDFTWKDVAAAARLDQSMQDYVIGGMDPDFREQLFRAGQAMDAAGINWTILSGFRDDYRQELASGLKAHPGRSFHGGSISTGGYGHGCAVDLASVEGGVANWTVWQWLDAQGAKFGLQRPLPRIDPAHVQPRGPWHQLAASLRGDEPGAQDGLAAQPLPKKDSAAPVRAAIGEDQAIDREAACTHARLAVPSPSEAELLKGLPRWPSLLPAAHRTKPDFTGGRVNLKIMASPHEGRKSRDADDDGPRRRTRFGHSHNAATEHAAAGWRRRTGRARAHEGRSGSPA